MHRTYLRPPQLIALPDLLAQRAAWTPLGLERGAAWDDARRIALVDSIARGLPAGTLALWRTSHALGAATHGPHTHILDGARRVAALASAFTPADGDAPLFMSLDAASPARFMLGAPEDALPVAALLDVRRRAQLLRALPGASAERERRSLLVDRIAGGLARYAFTVLTLETDSVDDAADALARLNDDPELGAQLRAQLSR
jgi:hypothetical protein